MPRSFPNFECLLLFRECAGCQVQGQNFLASMLCVSNTNLSLDVTYAYYFPSTPSPPGAPSTSFCVGFQPSTYLVVGNARLQAQSERKNKIIDTIGYSGLSVKGLATVGPSLDLYGQVIGVVQSNGEIRAGVQTAFDKAEVYWP